MSLRSWFLAGGILVASIIAALGFVSLSHADLGIGAGLLIDPLLVAAFAWAFVYIARLRLVGFLPSNACQFIPSVLHPWLQFWLLLRVGLWGAVLLLLATIIGFASTGREANRPGQAFVYVMMLRLFADFAFGTAVNVAIISRRHVSR